MFKFITSHFTKRSDFALLCDEVERLRILVDDQHRQIKDLKQYAERIEVTCDNTAEQFNNLEVDEIARQASEVIEIDYSELSERIDLYRLADQFHVSDVADYIDKSDVADYIDTADIAREVAERVSDHEVAEAMIEECNVFSDVADILLPKLVDEVDLKKLADQMTEVFDVDSIAAAVDVAAIASHVDINEAVKTVAQVKAATTMNSAIAEACADILMNRVFDAFSPTAANNSISITANSEGNNNDA